jgi:hypothetical protein
MSGCQTPSDADELRDIFVSVTGDDTVTEHQEEESSKEPLESSANFEGIEDGLDDAVGADLDSE